MSPETVGALANLGAFLLEHRIKSFGPNTGIELITVRHSVEEKLSLAVDPEVRALLQHYIRCLDFVNKIAILHQGLVIEQLAQAVESFRDGA